MNAKGVEHPDIFTESGRFIVASQSVLIAPVLELFSHDYQTKSLKLKEKNPPLIEELRELNSLLSPRTCIEYMHDALDHMESLLTLFNLGISTPGPPNAEIWCIRSSKVALPSAGQPVTRHRTAPGETAGTLPVNGSIFRASRLPGLRRQFPIMPLDRLDVPTSRRQLVGHHLRQRREIRFKPERLSSTTSIWMKRSISRLCVGRIREIWMNRNPSPTPAGVRFSSATRV